MGHVARQRALWVAAIVTLGLASVAADFTPVPSWLKLPAGRPQLGNMYGDIAVSAKGDVFVLEFNLFGRVHTFDRR